MRSDPPDPGTIEVVELDRYRTPLARMARGSMRASERVLAILPFVSTPKRPKGPEGKVKVGVYQSYRRYRPMVVTDQRLLVFESGRTPNPREILAAFAVDDVELVSVGPGSFGATRFVLELPGVGKVPFDAGRRDLADLAVLLDRLGGPPA
jgi:hypothetical protein